MSHLFRLSALSRWQFKYTYRFSIRRNHRLLKLISIFEYNLGWILHLFLSSQIVVVVIVLHSSHSHSLMHLLLTNIMHCSITIFSHIIIYQSSFTLNSLICLICLICLILFIKNKRIQFIFLFSLRQMLTHLHRTTMLMCCLKRISCFLVECCKSIFIMQTGRLV